MLYRPNFCCSCGEKIERTEWTLWASRRFCELCETDHKVQEVVPRMLVALGLIVGLTGAFGFLRSPGEADRNETQRTFASSRVPANIQPQVNSNATPAPLPQSQTGFNGGNASAPVAVIGPPAKPPAVRAADEQLYYCGALTKKGTPCSRRVKKGERCWQHTGMPSVPENENRRLNR